MKKLTPYILILPLLLGCTVFFIYPFFLNIGYSLTTGYGSNAKFSGLENYVDILNNDAFTLAFSNTMKFLIISLPLVLAISYILSITLKNGVSRNKIFKSVFLLPYIMPIVGTVLLIETIFAERGLLNDLLLRFGVPLNDWLNSEYSFWVVVLLFLWKNTGYSTILMLSGLLTIPQEHYEAADMDGANGMQKFWFITNPQMHNTVFLTVIFTLINAFKCFREIFLIGGEHPNNSVYMLQHFINNTFKNMNYFKLSTASVLLFLVLSICFLVFYLFIIKTENTEVRRKKYAKK